MIFYFIIVDKNIKSIIGIIKIKSLFYILFLLKLFKKKQKRYSH